MTIEFGARAALWLFAVLPLLWAAWRFSPYGREGRLHPIVRSLILACLVLALAQPVLTLPASRVAVVYLVDVSHSVAAHALETTAATIDALNAAIRPDQSRILAFGGRAAPVADTASLRRMTTADPSPSESSTQPETTNLEAALIAARAEIPASTNGRIVLFTDGRETEGRATRAAERLAAEHVPVFTTTLPERDLGDAWIEAVRLPRTAVTAALTTLDVVVGSQKARAVDVSVREGTRVLATKHLAVEPGTIAIPIDVSFDAPGPHLVEASLTADGDVLAENNTLAREIVAEPRPRVLYVHAPEDSPVAPVALAQAGVEMTVAGPKELPTRPEALDRWDVVVLSDVARAQVATASMAALGSWVENRGGGLLFIGGNSVFGEDLDRAEAGYRRTEIERLLPVTFDRDDDPEVALVIVLDRSWSMNGASMELSKSAAEAAANTLSPQQMVGVLTFNDSSDWDLPLARVRDSKATLHDAISKISASGPTAIYPALERAYDALLTIRARAKHVILLSDGQTNAENFEALVKKMTDARITVSSVALGPEADVTLLRNIATWGGGRNYVVQDAKQIPEIFVKEAKGASAPGADEKGAIAATIRPAASVLDGVNGIPPLYGRNQVTRKPQAVELLSTSHNDPLLAIWPAGLGRTGMLAADVDGQWSREWMTWRGFGPFLSSVVRALSPHRTPPSSLDVIAGEREGAQRALTVTLDARGGDGQRVNLLTPSVDVRRGSAERAVLPLTQVAPGQYQARVVADTSDPLVFAVSGAAGDAAASRVFVDDQQAEYRFGPADETLLSAIAHETGGAAHATADDLRRAPRGASGARHPLAPWLFVTALALWPIDITLRRFRR